MLVMHEDEVPVVVLIYDCIGLMVDGGKKDASLIVIF